MLFIIHSAREVSLARFLAIQHGRGRPSGPSGDFLTEFNCRRVADPSGVFLPTTHADYDDPIINMSPKGMLWGFVSDEWIKLELWTY
jgi:hypothetical protein